MFRENKTKIWILALLMGAAAGFLLATRLNLLPLTNAEYETVLRTSHLQI